MRSIPLLAATTVMLTFVWACGDDGGNVGPNNDPVATFTVGACTVGVACTFTDTSTDPDGNNTIVSRTWDFGDGSPLVQDVTNPSHTFAAASTYQVKLTVTDNAGASASVTNPVVVSGTANTPPIASFTAPACTVNIGCLFTDASSDPDGTIASWSWNFGDGSPAAPDQNPSHTYAAAGTFNVTLTVTDNLGATGTVTLPVTVSPPTATQCTVAGTVVSCVLTMTQRSTVTITLTSRDCELSANKVAVAQPRRQNIFFNVCSETVGEQKTVTDATGAPMVLEVGAQLVVEFTQGVADVGDPTPGAPAAEVDGTSPTWTVNIDDGGNPTGPGEPDFDDVVLTVQATPAS